MENSTRRSISEVCSSFIAVPVVFFPLTAKKCGFAVRLKKKMSVDEE